MNRRPKKEINFISLSLQISGSHSSSCLLSDHAGLLQLSPNWIHLSLAPLASCLLHCSVLPGLLFLHLLYFIFLQILIKLESSLIFLVSLQLVFLYLNVVCSQHLEQSVICSNHSEYMFIHLIMVVFLAEVWSPVAEETLLGNHQLLTIHSSKLFIVYLLCTRNCFRPWGTGMDSLVTVLAFSFYLPEEKNANKQINEKIVS